MSIMKNKTLPILVLGSALGLMALESSGKEDHRISISSKDDLDPRITQVFDSDWSVVKVRESSFVIRLKPSALERLAKKAAAATEHFEKSPGSIETIIDWANDNFKSVPDAEGTISISFLPPPEQNLDSSTLKELQEVFDASPFALKMQPRLWKVTVSFSSLPSPETVKEAIKSIENELKKRTIFPASPSKSSLQKAWDFAKASIVEVELIIHLKV
ncbi:MAG: hypothetical protein B7Y25_04705 [Alphaproteobacteria bacterium 16-39-46]|nr:MAG: hypothetical protein B7Y25_04705 [Alphaproteobacteria bacterium 16-39-46]OZA42898.1 MAG: hypothetical protein B7X84_04530 [Alphaproteobacteria bacterium 17-39-52]HQS84237.1 hypothetical protein [Alphaproteobacteria bacterium]HQS94060.1 hypothetical protein [Alphaproteobacteria bacterium]